MVFDPRLGLPSMLQQKLSGDKKFYVMNPAVPSKGIPGAGYPKPGIPQIPQLPGDGKIRLLYGVPRAPVPPGWTHIAPPEVKTQPKLPPGYIWITNVNTGQTKVILGKQ